MNKIEMKRIIMLLIVMLFGITLFGCNSKDNTEFNRETIKQNLKSYVNNIDKSETIKCNLTLVENIINDEVNEFKKNDYLNNSVQMENKVKKEIDKLILTKELEAMIKEDFSNYKYKDKYGYEIYPSARCYGIYNSTVVMFVLLPEDIETNINFENVNFYYPSAFTILVWHNHTFYSFDNIDDAQKIINNGILSKSDVNFIKDIHEQWGI